MRPHHLTKRGWRQFDLSQFSRCHISVAVMFTLVTCVSVADVVSFLAVSVYGFLGDLDFGLRSLSFSTRVFGIA